MVLTKEEVLKVCERATDYDEMHPSTMYFAELLEQEFLNKIEQASPEVHAQVVALFKK